jgi:hypothetical protein
MNDLGLALVLLALHLTAIGAGGGLLVLAFRSDTTEEWSDGGSEGPGGEPDLPPKPPTMGGPTGPPLIRSQAARLRLRARRPLSAERGLRRHRGPCQPHKPARTPQPRP